MSFAIGAAGCAGMLATKSVGNGNKLGVFSTTKSNNPPATTTGGRVHPGKQQAVPRRRSSRGGGARRAVVMASSEQESQDAYNKAMAEYSKTPFEYRHDLGLCRIPSSPAAPQPPKHSENQNTSQPPPHISSSLPRLSPSTASELFSFMSRAHASPRDETWLYTMHKPTRTPQLLLVVFLFFIF